MPYTQMCVQNVCRSSSVRSCVCEIMHVCVCKYVYAMACLCADLNWPITVYGLIVSHALLVCCYWLCFSLVYYVCVKLCSTCFFSVRLCWFAFFFFSFFFSYFYFFLISKSCIYCSFSRPNFQEKTTLLLSSLPFGFSAILCIDVCAVILASINCNTSLLPKMFILEY